MQLDRLINEYHWGAIYTRPNLDPKSRAICALSAMTVLGRYDRQIRRRIEGALRIGMSPREVMEVFIQVMLYGGYFKHSDRHASGPIGVCGTGDSGLKTSGERPVRTA